MHRRERVTCELKEIRAFNGWSQEEVAHRLGISRSTVQSIEGGEPVKKFTADLVRTMHAQTAPSDWPACIHFLREEYTFMERTLARDDFKRYINNKEHLLEGLRALDSRSIETAGYLWLLAWVAQDRAKVFNEYPSDNRLRALSRYEKSIAILSALVKDGLTKYTFLLNKAKLAQWVCFYDSKDEDRKNRDNAMQQWIISNDLISVAYACAAREPFQWSAIRNGLVMASILKREEDCMAFFRLLVAADENFEDLDFQIDQNVLPLSENPDVDFFLQKFEK